MRRASKFSTLPFVAVCKHYFENSTISLENVSQVDNDSGMFDIFNEEDNKSVIKEDDSSINCITQETLDDLPLTQEMFRVEKIERLTLFVKNPQVLVQWVNYKVPTWEPLVLMFPQMANDIACYAVKNNKMTELHHVLKRLKIYDNTAES
eukprot:202677-Ditylum_brightwellii.AAC.1